VTESCQCLCAVFRAPPSLVPKIVFIVGGQTAWQDPEEKEKNLNRLFPKLWYGWIGKDNWQLEKQF
jgi:hypothetical protein